ncbi:uncharacterized protein LOC124291073 [Haliotis rubra]|uniref:uncharacterized protein LOC124291073 n=1 Tax=Haliotis rubra TaxID=36100 RepID=UPI001EE5EDC2|nr:uncharacterized protein LOC124291073 [Haliotis rubra]
MGQSFSALGRCAKRVEKNQRRAAKQLRKLSTEMRRFEVASYLARMANGFRGIDQSALVLAGTKLGLSGTLVSLGIAASSVITSFLTSRTMAPFMTKIQTALNELDGDLRRLVEELKKNLDETDAANMERGLRNRTVITISSKRQNARKAVQVVNRTIEALNLFEQQNGLPGIVSRIIDYLTSFFHPVVDEELPVLQITAIVECCLKDTHNVTTTADLLDTMAGILER